MRASIVFLCGFLIGLLGLAVLLYSGWATWVNERGSGEWRAALDELRAKGEPTDFSTLIPARIPDRDNLAALPLFHVEREGGTGPLEPLRLTAALENITRSESDFFPNGWSKGDRMSAAKLELLLSRLFHEVFPSRPIPAAALDQFDALCPAIDELRQESLSRAGCRFDEDYTTMPPYVRSLGLTTEIIALAQVINLHAILALDSGTPDLALQDIELSLKLDSGLRQEPELVPGLVAIGVVAVQLSSIGEGLEDHAWTDAQLARLQRELASIDFLPDCQLCLRGEALGYFAPMIEYLQTHQAATGTLIAGLSNTESDHNATVLKLLWKITPRGLFDQARARWVTLYFKAARETVDLHRRVAHPARLGSVEEEAKNESRFSLPGLLLRISAGPVLSSGKNFCVVQFKVDAARVACMIERYRLAHGSLPTSLDQLAPYADGGAGLPHDLCNGEPLHYSVRPDGTYLLYSVGWNQLDDGGQVVYRSDQPKSVDYEKGDWLWPQPGHPGT